VAPARTAVVEDAVAGVQAGVAGGFAQTIGVDREGRGERLLEAGADLVVADLDELALDEAGRLVAPRRSPVPSTPAATTGSRAR
jgi:beta-phosphoglucomutase-like phosphatase (HAD superfamily)